MAFDAEVHLPLSLADVDPPPLRWSSLTEVIDADDTKRMRRLMHDHGATAVLLPVDRTRRETTLCRAAKGGAIKCLALLLSVRDGVELVDLPNSDGLTPLLAALKAGELVAATLLVEKGANVNARDDRGCHALHLLCFRLAKAGGEEGVFQSMDFLLANTSVDLDPINNLGMTPMLSAAKEIDETDLNLPTNINLIAFCRKLFENGASLSSKGSEQTAREILSEKEILTKVQANGSQSTREKPWVSEMYDSLIIQDNTVLKNILNSQNQSYVKKMINCWLGSTTVLTYVVDRMNVEATEAILNAGADPWKVSCSGEMTVHRALIRGNYETLDLLLTHMKLTNLLDFRSFSFSLFSKLFENEKKSENSTEGINRSGCLKRLFADDIKMNVNDERNSDKIKETVLHLAASFGNQEALELLLEHGSFLGARHKIYENDCGTVLQAINYQTLESAMNKSILHHSKQEDEMENVLDPDYTLSLDYGFIVPPNINKESNDFVNEVDTLMEIKESSIHRPLVKHPLIQTFLYAKWRKVLPLYITNLLIYLLFVMLLTCLMYWLTDLRVLELKVQDSNSTQRSSYMKDVEDYTNSVFIMKILILIPLCYMVLREAFQIYFTYKTYLHNIENYMEWFLLISVIILINFDLSVDVTRHLSAWVMIIAWYEFVLILGKAPPLAIYVTMLRHVSWNFLKLIFLYGALILAFAISFNIILKPTSDTNSSGFMNFWSTLPKAIVMATGEFEYSDLSEKFPQNVVFTISTVLIFMAFLFLIFLVLMNVMNGLAVSDTTQVMEDATLYSLTSRLELIFLIEELFRSVPFLRPSLSRIHILTGPNNTPKLLARINLAEKGRRLVIGKEQVENYWNPRKFNSKECCKLDSRTTRALKSYRLDFIESEKLRKREDPIEQCLSILQNMNRINAEE